MWPTALSVPDSKLADGNYLCANKPTIADLFRYGDAAFAFIRISIPQGEGRSVDRRGVIRRHGWRGGAWTGFPQLISGLRKPIAIQAAISFNMNLPE